MKILTNQENEEIKKECETIEKQSKIIKDNLSKILQNNSNK